MGPRMWGLCSRLDWDSPVKRGLAPVDRERSGKVGSLRVGSLYARLLPSCVGRRIRGSHSEGLVVPIE